MIPAFSSKVKKKKKGKSVDKGRTIFKLLKTKKQKIILEFHLRKKSFKNKTKLKTFRTDYLRKFSVSRLALQDLLKKVFQIEG